MDLITREKLQKLRKHNILNVILQIKMKFIVY